MDTKEKIIAMMEEEAVNNGKTRKKKIAYYKGRYDTIKKIVLNLVEGMELTKDYLLHEVSEASFQMQYHDSKKEYYTGCYDMLKEVAKLYL